MTGRSLTARKMIFGFALNRSRQNKGAVERMSVSAVENETLESFFRAKSF